MPSLDSLQLDLPAVPKSVRVARHAAAGVADGRGFDLWAVRTAVSEAVSNAVAHAFHEDGPGTVKLSVAVFEGMLTITVEDDGSGMKPRLESPGLGMGISIIEAVSERLSLEESPGGGTRVTMDFLPSERDAGRPHPRESARRTPGQHGHLFSPGSAPAQPSG